MKRFQRFLDTFLQPAIIIGILIIFAGGVYAATMFDDQVVPRTMMKDLADRGCFMSDIVTIAGGGTVEWAEPATYMDKIYWYAATNTLNANAIACVEDAGTFTVTGTASDTVLIVVFGRKDVR